MATVATSTVTTPASTYDLALLADVKLELGITSGDTTNDVLLGKWISRDSAAIANYCNRIFPAETLIDSFLPDRDPYPFQNPNGTDTLMLTRLPIQRPVGSGSTPTLPLAPIITENGTLLVEGTDYQVDYAAGLIYRLGNNGFRIAWPAWNVTVTYTGGYATIPLDLADACIGMVQARWLKKQNDDPYLKSEELAGVGKLEYWVPSDKNDSGNIPPAIAGVINKYRMPRVA